MSLAERIQGPPRTRKRHYPEKKDNGPSRSADPLKDAIFPFAPPRPKPQSLAGRFRHPIVKVKIQTGQVEINELREYWSEEGITRG